MKGLFEKKDVSASFSKTHSKIKPSENNLETHFRRLYSTSIWPLSELTLSSQQGCADVRKDWRPGHVSLAPPCSNHGLSDQMYCTEESTCDIVETFQRSLVIRLWGFVPLSLCPWSHRQGRDIGCNLQVTRTVNTLRSNFNVKNSKGTIT